MSDTAHHRSNVLDQAVSRTRSAVAAPVSRTATIVQGMVLRSIAPSWPLMPAVLAPSTIFAAYNHITAEKQIEVFPFHKHEVPYEHNETKFRLLVETLRP